MPGHGPLRDRMASAQLPSGGENILPREEGASIRGVRGA